MEKQLTLPANVKKLLTKMAARCGAVQELLSLGQCARKNHVNAPHAVKRLFQWHVSANTCSYIKLKVNAYFSFLKHKRFYSDHSLIFCCCLFSIAILKLISLDLKCFIGDVKFLKFSWKADIRDKFHGFIAYIQSRKEKMEILIFSLTFFLFICFRTKRSKKVTKKDIHLSSFVL